METTKFEKKMLAWLALTSLLFIAVLFVALRISNGHGGMADLVVWGVICAVATVVFPLWIVRIGDHSGPESEA